ncbi:MAG: signal peptidase I [Candidatus Cloacimonetes bacterium]|nr:signal peptidase I [Candidatus Cloacimonadota bacterium]
MFKKKEKKIKRKKHLIQEYTEAILFAFVVAFVIKNYIFQNFKIPSSSMESTMLIGDYLYGDRLKYYFTEPQREDIVIFQYPADPAEPGLPTVENPNPKYSREDFALLLKPVYWDKINKKIIWHQKKNVVKRIIGMPGDTITVVNKEVFINGNSFVRDYEQHIDSRIVPYDRGDLYWNNEFMGSRDNFGPVIVPEDHYFVLGDNRDVSADSRFWGFLGRKEITGRPLFIFFSLGQPPAKDIRELVLRQQGIINPPSNVRWNRLFKFY